MHQRALTTEQKARLEERRRREAGQDHVVVPPGIENPTDITQE